jgi:phage tail-like protein
MADPSPAYIAHLPEIFRAPLPDGTAPFLADFLKVFEAVLTGRDDTGVVDVEGLEQLVERFPDFIDAALAPIDDPAAGPTVPLRSAFLDYLASWAALTLDQNWDLEKKREWTRRIMALYKRRGTRAGLQDYLNTFVGDDVFISEPPGGFTLADLESSILGVNTFLSGAPAYYFRVGINYAFGSPFTLAGWLNIQRGTRAIIELEKPAHTYYTLQARTPGFVLALPGHTVLGQETLLWAYSNPLEF